MRKVYRKLTADQKARGVIFSSCLSEYTQEIEGNTVHEVKAGQENTDETIKRLLNDRFFNASHFKYNIVRRGEKG
jgi:hypothetical protein